MAKRVTTTTDSTATATDAKPEAVTPEVAYVAVYPPLCLQVPYGEVQVDGSGAASASDSDSSPGSHPYDSKGKVIVGIRRLLRAQKSLAAGDVEKEFPDLFLAAKGFYNTWKDACYASGVNEGSSKPGETKSFKLARQTRVQRPNVGPDGKHLFTQSHTIELIVKLLKKNEVATSGDFIEAYGPGAYSRMLTQFGRFAKALAAAEESIKGEGAVDSGDQCTDAEPTTEEPETRSTTGGQSGFDS